jgi:hypothetical protein
MLRTLLRIKTPSGIMSVTSDEQVVYLVGSDISSEFLGSDLPKKTNCVRLTDWSVTFLNTAESTTDGRLLHCSAQQKEEDHNCDFIFNVRMNNWWL